MKVLALSNQARSMSQFWRVLISKMTERGMEVACAIPQGDPDWENHLEGQGCRVINYSLDRKGLNPLADVRTFLELKNLFLREKPDMLFATTIKPVIYGCLAAHAAKVPAIFATITGLGYAFEADSFLKKQLKRLSSRLYARSLANADGIFFQNQDDAALFQQLNILKPDARVLFAHGTGVDTTRFGQTPLPPLPSEGEMKFLLIGRLLEAKGIPEYAKAARMLKDKWPQAHFQLLGLPEQGPGAIPMEKIQAWQNEGILEYLGATDDVRPYITNAHVVVLPSWREGAPTAIMEAMSMGRSCVVSDAPGCRDMVIDGQSGFITKTHDPSSLAEGMGRLLANPGLLPAMGARSREIAVTEYDGDKVSEGILDVMCEIATAKQKGQGQ